MAHTVRRPPRAARPGWRLAALITGALAGLAPARAQLPVACGAGCGPGTWVSSGAATRQVAGTTLSVRQASERAILNWQSFDIGPQHRVVFEQPSPSAVALNRIFQGSPSQIQGQLSANGQVYLINQNGILFGEGARVNVNSLVASTLDVDDGVFNGVGVVGAINEGTGRAAFAGAGPMGAVEVAAGARIESAAGGRVMLLGPTVRNAGTVSTPEGQAVLAASSDAVYLAASNDPDLRGLLVEVGSGGEASNLGEILAARGNASLVGLAVNQSGRVQATTTTSLAGSVRLVAQDRARVDVTASAGNRPQATRGGVLTLGPGSATAVLPEGGPAETAVDAQQQPRSWLTLSGEQVRLGQGAEVVAPSGRVTVTAARDPSSPVLPSTPKNASRVLLEPGSRIDVSGDDSTVLPMSRNAVEVELRGNELRDAPAQRDGPLRNQRVFVDVRRGTPLADASGAIAGIRRGVRERLADGGTVSLRSEGDIHLMAGSRVDASGGAVRYESGMLPTTTLLTADRRLVTLADADPLLPYAGVFGDLTRDYAKWSQQDRFGRLGQAMRWEAGYTEGRDAGSIELVARALVLAGDLAAGTTPGVHQRRAPDALASGAVRPYDQLPVAGLLSIGDGAQAALAEADFRTPDVRFGPLGPDPYGAEDRLPANLELTVDPMRLAASGVARLAVYSNGRIRVPTETEVRLPAGGSVSLVGADVEIAGTVAAPAGTVRAEGRKTPGVQVGAARVALTDSARVEVGGLWVDERPGPAGPAPAGPLLVNGGSVTLRASGPLDLASGSRVDASGGAQVTGGGDLRPGKGGSLDVAVAFEDARPLALQGSLSAYGLSQGGSLTLRAAGLRIGSGTPGTTADGTLILDPGFFGRGGFQSFDLSATHTGVTVAAGTRVDLLAENWVLQGLPPPGAEGRPALATGVLPAWQRRPTHLKLGFVPENGDGLRLEPMVLGAGSVIVGQPGAQVSLRSETGLLVDGAVQAPGGAVTLSLPRATRLDRGYDPALQIRLGAGARLDARAVAVAAPAGPALAPAGTLRDGGAVTLKAERGYIVGEAGARIDVSGAAAAVGAPLRPALGQPPARAVVHAPAGAIALQAAEGVFYAGDLVAAAAPVPGAAGGALSVGLVTAQRESGNPVPGQPVFPGGPREVVVGEVAVPDLARGVPVPAALNGLAYVVPSRVAAGGFDTLTLRADPVGLGAPLAGTSARVRLVGDLTLGAGERLVLDAPVLASQGGVATLTAPYVALGHQSAVYAFTPGANPGSGVLRVEADHIDLVGHATLQGFGGAGAPAATLASRGDLRLRGLRLPPSAPTPTGSLAAAGDLWLEAARVYPSTLSQFTLQAGPGAVRFGAIASGAPSPPLSAGGRLTVQAARITQGGALTAPFGTVELRASERLDLLPGSLTSSSGAGALVPFGQVQFGQDWVYALSGSVQVLDRVPERSVVLEAPAIVASPGSVIDVAGGGDLLAHEFVPGPGGSVDVLLPDNLQGTFAVLPSLGSLYAPYDPLESEGFEPAPGATVHLAAGGGLAAGEYARLPPRYALLPGAFLVTPLGGGQELPAGASLTRADGATVVAGRTGEAGSSSQGARWSGYLLEDGQRVRARAEYRETLASAFFGGAAGLARTADAGRVSVTASAALSLAGRLAQTPAGGRGAAVDIAADRLAVVAAPGPAGGRIEVLASDLAQLGATSLLLGGTRAAGDDALALTATATEIGIEPGVRLELPELTLIARDRVAVAEGVELRGAGATTAGAGAVAVRGDGALLRVASAGQVEVRRDSAPGALGTLEVAGGALIGAEGAVTLEATRDTRFAGRIAATGASVALGSSRISLGDPPPGTGGLVLGTPALETLDARELVLSSASSIDLHGALRVGGPGLERLVLDAGAVRAVAGGDSTLAAATVVLTDRRGAPPAPVPGVGGSLTLAAAGELVLAEGGYALQGFDRVDLRAGAQVRGEGTGRLEAQGDLYLTAPWIAGTNGADLGITASGALGVTRGPGEATAPASLGARVALAGRELRFGGRLALASGTVSLAATGPAGELRLTEGALVDVAGTAIDFDGVAAGSPGGQVRLASASGALTLEAGVRLDVSGSPAGGDGGRLDLSAPGGVLTVDAASEAVGRAGAGGTGGRLGVDAGSLAAGTLARLGEFSRETGFGAENRLRVRTGPLAIEGEGLRAQAIAVSADQGSLTVAGTLDASGPQGGQIRLSAGGDLVVTGGARLRARASAPGGAGGTVSLETLADLTLAATDRAGETSVDVSPGADGEAGHVRLVAPRLGVTDLRLLDLDATVAGAGRLEAVGVRSYEVEHVSPATLAGPQADAAAFMEGAGAVAERLGRAGDPAFRLVPGITLRSSGDLTLASDWDLQAPGWRPGGAAGLITLQAAGDLRIDRSLSDGVVTVDPIGYGRRETVTDTPSWSLRLVAGADPAGADPLAVREGLGDVRLADGQRVRTGSGSIEVAAGRDVVLGGARAAVYTVGENRGASPVLDPLLEEFLLGADYLRRGGDLTVRAGRDIRADAASAQLVNQWLSRIGGVIGSPDGSGEPLPIPTGWAVAVGDFRQHLGALAGGAVTLEAGRRLDRVSAAVATTGRPEDTGSGGPAVSVAGGGSLRVTAGEDVRGGVFYVAGGTGRVVAGGALASPAPGTPAPILALGDATLEVTTGRELALATVLNPTVLPQGRNQGWRDDTGIDLDNPSYFFTYAPTSAVHLSAIAGEVRLVNDPEPIDRQTRPADLRPEVALQADVAAGFAGTTYPGSLTARSLAGDLILERPMRLFPAARGRLELLAAGDVTTGGGAVSVVLSDADPARLPGVAWPAPSFDSAVPQLAVQARDPSLIHAGVPVHTGDPEPVRVVARQGTVGASGGSALTLVLAKAARVSAGLDVSNLNLQVQHVAASDQTVVRAGRDLSFPTLRSGGGFSANVNRIEVAGPGRVDLIAGRHVDLGTSAGVLTVGNTTNPALGDGGAEVAVLAGLAAGVDYGGFAARYLGQGDEYAAALTGYLEGIGAPPGPGQTPLEALLALPAERQAPFLLETVLFGELLASGNAAAESGSGDYTRGFEAVRALFPGEGYHGDVSLLLSRVSTLDGGDITLVAPGGKVNAGVTVTTGIAKGAGELGVVAQRAGDIRAFVHRDFEVNASRVFTLDGGDIVIWSSAGDIDAGRGAKTAIAAPPPRISFDSNGNLVVEPSAAVSGSGIRTAVTTTGREPGSVSLFAPAGVVRAGDAGIAAAGNLTIGATRVIGSDNISAGGQSVGVPVAQTGSLAAGLTGVSNVAASATKATEQQATAVAEKQSSAAAGQAAAQQALALITVDVLGFGP